MIYLDGFGQRKGKSACLACRDSHGPHTIVSPAYSAVAGLTSAAVAALSARPSLFAQRRTRGLSRR